MRLPIFCTDVKSYTENPELFLPDKVLCPNNPLHTVHRHGKWFRNLLDGHVFEQEIYLYQWRCLDCHEVISLWPEFVLPYQPEPVETHEQAAIDYLSGMAIKDIAAKINYDPRTVSRWIHRIMEQAFLLMGYVYPLLQAAAGELLPLYATGNFDTTKNLFALVRQFVQFTAFPRRTRLIGLCNVISKGRFIVWGGAVGRCRKSRHFLAGIPPNSHIP